MVAVSRFCVSTTDNDDVATTPWTSPLSSSLAYGILDNLLSQPDCPTRFDIVRCILLDHIKPLFQQTPHKRIHPDTGRKLSRQRGGEQFGDSWVEELWKGKTDEGEQAGAVGCWRVLQSALGLLHEQKDIEELWPAVVPPLMTLLDDHETRYRTEGVRCLHVLLDRVPGSLLKKTGLGELIQNVSVS